MRPAATSTLFDQCCWVPEAGNAMPPHCSCRGQTWAKRSCLSSLRDCFREEKRGHSKLKSVKGQLEHPLVLYSIAVPALLLAQFGSVNERLSSFSDLSSGTRQDLPRVFTKSLPFQFESEDLLFLLAQTTTSTPPWQGKEETEQVCNFACQEKYLYTSKLPVLLNIQKATGEKTFYFISVTVCERDTSPLRV
jgi:hypothetical protein